jgi:predicted ArsR family transcriptional regulator
MKTTRQQIIEYLKRNKTATTRELGHALSTTQANIRHHLSNLQLEGIIETAGESTSRTPGRPRKIFTLTSESHSHNFDLHFTNKTPEEIPDILRMIADQVLAKYDYNSSNIAQRLYKAINILNQMHYQARWEARANAPQLIFEHCPYIAILNQYPVMCVYDKILIEIMLGKPIEQTSKLCADNRGRKRCLFTIQDN